MARIGDLTGRSMAEVASAIGQSLGGNDALNMHNTRAHKNQVGAPSHLRQWEDYDPNPYVPPSDTGALILTNVGVDHIYNFTAYVFVDGQPHTYTGSGIPSNGHYQIASYPRGVTIQFYDMVAYHKGDPKHADYVDNRSHMMIGDVYRNFEFY